MEIKLIKIHSGKLYQVRYQMDVKSENQVWDQFSGQPWFLVWYKVKNQVRNVLQEEIRYQVEKLSD